MDDHAHLLGHLVPGGGVTSVLRPGGALSRSCSAGRVRMEISPARRRASVSSRHPARSRVRRTARESLARPSRGIESKPRHTRCARGFLVTRRAIFMAISASSSSRRRRCSTRATDAASRSAWSSAAAASRLGSGWGAAAMVRADLDICRYDRALHIAGQAESLQNDMTPGRDPMRPRSTWREARKEGPRSLLQGPLSGRMQTSRSDPIAVSSWPSPRRRLSAKSAHWPAAAAAHALVAWNVARGPLVGLASAGAGSQPLYSPAKP